MLHLLHFGGCDSVFHFVWRDVINPYTCPPSFSLVSPPMPFLFIPFAELQCIQWTAVSRELERAWSLSSRK